VATPGKEGEFIITTNDRFQNRCSEGGAAVSVTLVGGTKKETIKGEVKDLKNGIYECAYDIENAGDYQMSVLVNKEHIQGSPFLVEARPGRTHPASTEDKQPKKETAAGSDVALVLQLKDVKGNLRDKGGDKVKVKLEQVVTHEVDAIDNGDGTFGVIVPGHMHGDLKIAPHVEGEAVGSGMAVTAKPVAVSKEHEEVVKRAMPGNQAMVLKMLGNMNVSERESFVLELKSGLKDEKALKEVRDNESAARQQLADTKATKEKADSDAKAAKKASWDADVKAQKAAQAKAAEERRKLALAQGQEWEAAAKSGAATPVGGAAVPAAGGRSLPSTPQPKAVAVSPAAVAVQEAESEEAPSSPSLAPKGGSKTAKGKKGKK